MALFYLLAYVPFVGLSLVLLIAASDGVSSTNSELRFDLFKQTLHFGVFVFLGLLALIGPAMRYALRRRRTFALTPSGRIEAMLLACGLGALLELQQLGVPGRIPSILDATANVLGALCGVFVGSWVLNRRADRANAEMEKLRQQTDEAMRQIEQLERLDQTEQPR